MNDTHQHAGPIPELHGAIFAACEQQLFELKWLLELAVVHLADKRKQRANSAPPALLEKQVIAAAAELGHQSSSWLPFFDEWVTDWGERMHEEQQREPSDVLISEIGRDYGNHVMRRLGFESDRVLAQEIDTFAGGRHGSA